MIMSKSHYYDTGNLVFSYSTCIKQVVGELSIGNVTRYSNATGRHQSLAGVMKCDVLLDGVPKGAGELLDLAIERGLVPVGETFYVSGKSDLFLIEKKVDYAGA